MMKEKIVYTLILALALLPLLLLSSRAHAATWTIETVDSAGDVGWDTSLAFDPSGNPAISYLDETNYDLKYASPSQAPAPPEEEGEGGLAAGAIAGIAIGSCAAAGLIAYFVIRRRRAAG